IVFRQRKFQPTVSIEMAVGHVVRHLAQGPAAVTIRSVKLRVVKPPEGCAEFPRRGSNLVHHLFAGVRRDVRWNLQFANRIARVHGWSPLSSQKPNIALRDSSGQFSRRENASPIWPTLC